jgi:replicative DNA helicase
MKLYNTSISINCVSVIKELESDKTLNTIGGLNYIKKLKNSALSEKQINFLNSKLVFNKIIDSSNIRRNYPYRATN